MAQGLRQRIAGFENLMSQAMDVCGRLEEELAVCAHSEASVSVCMWSL